jgi:PBP1b-binding outer membrane lipoprotein LpoB
MRTVTANQNEKSKITILAALISLAVVWSGCSYFVPAYNNPISKKNENIKETEQKEAGTNSVENPPPAKSP